jgi:hypothetical protein
MVYTNVGPTEILKSENFVLRVLRGILHYIYREGTVLTKFAIVFDKKISLMEITAIDEGGESA